MLSLTFSVLLVGVLVATNSALLGSLLVLRKQAMLADAISHAVLPGLVIAYLLSGEKTGGPMLLGAAAFGLLCTAIIQVLHRGASLQADAAIGISFTTLFALGVVLISVFAGQVDLDQDCVLYGEIAYAPLDPVVAGGLLWGPRQALHTGAVLLCTVVALALFWKEWKLLCFDERYAASVGVPVRRLQWLLTGLVSASTVTSFESVGAILVVAFLVVPAATASMLTQRFGTLVLLSVCFAMAATVGGYFFSWWLGGSIAAGMAMCSGLIFAAVLFFCWWQARLGHQPAQPLQP